MSDPNKHYITDEELRAAIASNTATQRQIADMKYVHIDTLKSQIATHVDHLNVYQRLETLSSRIDAISARPVIVPADVGAVVARQAGERPPVTRLLPLEPNKPPYNGELDSQRTYPKDITGMNPNNRIVERHTVTTDNRMELDYIIPRYAPAFAFNLVLSRVDPETDELIPLTLGVDYYLGGLWSEPIEEVGSKDLISTIIFDDELSNGVFQLEYNTFGGQYTLDTPGYADAIANYLVNPLSTSWGEIVGRPLQYTADPHKFGAGDLIGWEDLVACLNRLGDVVLEANNEDNSANNEAMQDFFEYVKKIRNGGDEANEMRQKIESLRELVEQYKQADDARHAESANALNTYKSGIDTKLAGMTTAINDKAAILKAEIAAKITEVKNLMNNQYLPISTFNQEKSNLVQRIDEVDAGSKMKDRQQDERLDQHTTKLAELNQLTNTLKANMAAGVGASASELAVERNRINDLTPKVEKNIVDIRNLSSKVNEANTNANTAKSIASGVGETVANHLRNYNNYAKEMYATITNIRNSIDQRRQFAENVKQSVATVQRELNERINAVAASSSSNARLDQIDNRINTNDTAVRGLITTTDGKVTQLKSTMDTKLQEKQTAIDALKTKVATSEGNITRINNLVNTQGSKLNQVETKSTQNSTEITKMKQQLAALDVSNFVPNSKLQTNFASTLNQVGKIPVFGRSGELSGFTMLKFLDATNTSKAVQVNLSTITDTNNVAYNAVSFGGYITALGYEIRSDIRVKKNIRPVEVNYGAISKIGGYHYTLIGESEKPQIGVIAQEVETIYPELVSEDSEGLKVVNYNGLIAVLFQHINDLNKRVVELEGKVNGN